MTASTKRITSITIFYIITIGIRYYITVISAVTPIVIMKYQKRNNEKSITATNNQAIL